MTEITDVQYYVAPQIERRERLDMPLVGFNSNTPV
jgi:hypothetical protein